MEDIRTVELFAGVGGFRLGLETASKRFKTIWADQWEPFAKNQDAFDCYCKQWGPDSNCVNKDISTVWHDIPQHDLLVGGFPCQDYSIANKNGHGIEGKKGVLWWQINNILLEKQPKYVLLENVDRLLWSPRNQFGRDFSIILRCFYEAGYGVEWRVINAADYGFAQRRRRIFIFAFRKDTAFFEQASTLKAQCNFKGMHKWLIECGFFVKNFPIATYTKNYIRDDISINRYQSISDISNSYKAFYKNAGIMLDGIYYSDELIPQTMAPIPLKMILADELIDEHYYLKEEDMPQWIYTKGAKDEIRRNAKGKEFRFKEGKVPFPDSLDKPGRTIMTGESKVGRSSHVILDPKTNRLRVLTPLECERLNGFPDNWTNTGMDEKMRYFMMGNALVVPLVTLMGMRILEVEDSSYQ